MDVGQHKQISEQYRDIQPRVIMDFFLAASIAQKLAAAECTKEIRADLPDMLASHASKAGQNIQP
jgi:hypothetical protein